MRKIFKAQIKEVGNNHILTPSYFGDEHTTIAEVEDFWGVHEPDVEWYKIEEVTE